MDYTKLGNTDIEISKICVGCMSFGKAGIMHDWTLDEEQTAEENSPLTKNTVPFVHQKNQKLFAPGSHFIYLQNHTQKFISSIRFSSTQTALWKFCSLSLTEQPRLWLSLRPISISQLHALLHFHL